MLARWILLLGIFSVASLLLGPLLSGVRLLSPVVGLGLTFAGGALGIFGLLVGAMAAVRDGATAAQFGLVLCVLTTVLSAGFVLWARRYPSINDITTDTSQPPEFVRRLSIAANHGRDMTYPGESFAPRQHAAYHEIKPLPLRSSPAEAFHLVESVARSTPRWEITTVDSQSRTLEGIAETPLFRFQDDFVIEVRATDGGSIVHMRSRSRQGRGDLGVNARRIQTFFAALRQQAAAR
jgi:uncharacterized protein (DUF1499 family)